MPRAVRPAVSLALVMTCTVGTMLFGIALKSPCAQGSWGDGRQYRLLCYSDIVPLLGTEQLGDGRLPFLDACAKVDGQNCDEYPVLTMYFIRVAAWFSGDSYAGFFFVNAALLLGCAAVVGVCLYVMARGRALYLALAPTLLLYGAMNWDLFAVALATAALLAFHRRREGWAGVLLGLGAAAKFYPAMLVIPLIAQRLKDREPDRAITLGWTVTGTWLAVNLPFAVASPAGWFEFFRFNSARLADFDSLWYIACRRFDTCLAVGTINVASAALLLGAFIVIWSIKARRDPGFARWTLAFPLLILFLLTNKVYSPQYGLWLLPWFALALPDVRAFVAFSVADLAVFATRFSWFGEMQGLGGASQNQFEWAVLVRVAVLVWCLVSWIRRAPDALPIELPSPADAAETARGDPEAPPLPA
ncbi:MAG: glycosyltransferase 87 family protein [Actinomycetota bacterium]